MAARVRQFDWAETALGPADAWSPELKAATTFVLDSAFPAALVWGDDLVTIYNDGFVPILGDKPDALGRSFASIWAEAWSEIGPIAGKAFSGESTYIEDFPLTIDRSGKPEQAFFTFAYSPVRCADGRIGGMIDIVTETTDVARARATLARKERLQTFMLGLSDALRPIADPHVVADTACRLLVDHLDGSRALYTEVEGDPGAEVGQARGVHMRSGCPMPDRYPFAAFGEPLVATLRAGDTLVLADAARDPRLTDAQRQAFAAVDSPAAVSVPLVKEGRLVGTFTVQNISPRAWTAEEVALVEDTAERTWDAFERAKAEVARRVSEAHYRTLFETIAEGFCVVETVWDDDGRLADLIYREANRAYVEQTGFQPPPGLRVKEVAPDIEDHWMAFYDRVARTGVPETKQSYNADLNRWFRTNASRIDAAGRLLGIVVEDVSERHRAEQVLRDREARNRLLIGSWAQAVWETDATGVVVTDSPSWRAYTGQTLDEWLGLGWVGAVHPDDQLYAERQWRAAVAARELVNVEFRIRSPDGEYRWSNVRAAPVPDAEGRVEKWAGMNIDIHEGKLARQALDASELFTRALVEGVPQLVWRAVDGGDWTWASPQWTAFTGQSEPESHEHGWLEPVHPEDREGAMRFWHEAEATGRLEMEGRIRHAATGKYRWFQTRAMPVRAADGSIIEWLGTSTDVDDLRRLQDRQQILVAELQHRVRNILTVVRSVFTRTAEADTPLEQVVDHFRGRLDNLARTQVIVTQSASGAVDLHGLIFSELLSVGFAESPNVTLTGPDVTLDPTTAESISLAIHELTTNAVKYGALKLPGATLSVRWSTNSDYGDIRTLTLIWTEQGVPAVPVKPARQGFGSELIQEALPYRLGAETKLEFRGGGVRCTISVPLSDEAATTEAWETA